MKKYALLTLAFAGLMNAQIPASHGGEIRNTWNTVNGQVRANGSVVRERYVFQVKSPAESKGPWDYLKVVATLPADQVWTTKAETKCALWK